MYTYKLHALGDYVANIWLYGLTDNYSTQVVIDASEPLPSMSPKKHHHMSVSLTRVCISPPLACTMLISILDLKSHLLGRLLNQPFSGDHIYSDIELAKVKIVNN
ncbi:hypothetical protein L208DRAFT_1505001 [Tricholoma matsutake]|nr:hypothetical protein L208DRAFT_1505001 [Tricholoma matsutake 945]